MLWQTVCDLPPRRLGADEDVQLGANHGIIIERTGRDAHCRQVWGLAWSGRATNRAKGSKAPRSGFEAPYQITATQQPEFGDVHVDVPGERRTGQLAAMGALAMRHRSSCVDFESNAPAETGPADHAKDPQPRPYRAIVFAWTFCGCELVHTLHHSRLEYGSTAHCGGRHATIVRALGRQFP